MKKLIFLSAISLLVGSSANSQIPKNDWSGLELKGRVKSFREIYFLGDNTVSRPQSSKTLFFNEDGYRMEEYHYDNDSVVAVLFKYDGRGHVLEENDIAKGIVYTFKYDDRGYPVEEPNRSTGGKSSFKYTNTYDEKGHPIEIIGHFSQGGFLSKYTYKYDERGRPIEVKYYKPTVLKPKGKLEYTNIYKYDDKGNILEEPATTSDGLPGRFVYKYDDRGRKIETVNLVGFRFTYTYNEKGTLVEVIRFSPKGDLSNKLNYDENGNLLEDVSYKKNGDAFDSKSFTYEYDQNKNWIKRNDFFLGVKLKTFLRSFEYY